MKYSLTITPKGKKFLHEVWDTYTGQLIEDGQSIRSKPAAAVVVIEWKAVDRNINHWTGKDCSGRISPYSYHSRVDLAEATAITGGQLGPRFHEFYKVLEIVTPN